MTLRRIFPLILLAALAAAQPEPKPRKIKKTEDKEPVTQTLPEPKDPPAAVLAETGRLVFHVSPLSAKGLLSQQTRDALKALAQANRGATIVKLRAFVAGTGDLRRVQSIVSEVLGDKKQVPPALSTIQVGALPMEGAQVVIESVSVEKKTVNSKGLAFFSGQRAADAPAAVAQLEAAARDAKVAAADVMRLTCFLSSLDQVEPGRAAAARAFPSAAANFVQSLRLSASAFAVCEAAGRRGDTGTPAVSVSPAVALVNTPKLVLSGTQMAFQDQESDLRLAFERLEKSLEQLGVSSKDVVFAHVYPLTRGVEEKINALRPQFFAQPAGTTLLFEGLPSLDASMALEVVAAVRN